MNINLMLESEDFDEDSIQNLTREICTTINRETDFDASIGEQKSAIGTKGDPITIGAIVLAVLGTGGGAAALINVFKSFVDRSKELSIKLKKQNGDEIEISSKNIDSNDVKSMMDQFLTRP